MYPSPMQESNKDFYRRISETSPVLRDKAGFYTNALETVAQYLSIPKQVMFQIGKNIGEELTQKELTNDTFLTDLKNALKGESDVSFHDVMKSVDLDSLDVALPKEVLMQDNNFARWGTSILAGIGAGIVTTPVGGFLTAISTNDALQGKGIASSAGDVFLDPLNKLRIAPKTAKGLGITDEQFKALQKSGRLEDFVFNGKAYIPKTGTAKATENLHEVLIHTTPEEINKAIPAGVRNLTPQGGGKTLALIDDTGLETLLDSGLKSSSFSTVQRVGQYVGDGVEEIVVQDKNTGSLINQILKGDRRLFDFKGSTGLTINQTSPFFGKFLVPSPVKSIDLGNAMGGNYIADIMDKSVDFLGAGVAKIPGVSTKLADLEAATLGRVTGKISDIATYPFRALLTTGGDQGLKARKIFEDVLDDPKHPFHNSVLKSLKEFPGENNQQKLEQVEKTFRGLFQVSEQVKSILNNEADVYISNAIRTIKELAIAEGGKAVKNIQGLDERLLKAIEDGYKRETSVSLTELKNLDHNDITNTSKFIESLTQSQKIKADVNGWLVDQALKQNMQDIKEVGDITKTLKAFDPSGKLLKDIGALDDIHLPFNAKLNIETTPETIQNIAKGAKNEEAEAISFFYNKAAQIGKDLTDRKTLLEKNLALLEKEKGTSLQIVETSKAAVQKELEKVNQRILNNLEDEKTLIKFLNDPNLYDSAYSDYMAIKNRAGNIGGLVKESDREINSLQRKMDGLDKQISKLEGVEENPLINKKYSEYQSTLDNEKSRLKKVSSDIKIEENRYLSLKKRYEDIRTKELAKIDSGLTESEIQKMKDDYLQAKEKLDKLTQEKKYLPGRIKRIKNNLKETRKERLEKSNLLRQKGALDDLRAERAKLQTKQEELIKRKGFQESSKIAEDNKAKNFLLAKKDQLTKNEFFLRNERNKNPKLAEKNIKLETAEQSVTLKTEEIEKVKGKLSATESELRTVGKMTESLSRVLKIRGKDKVDISLMPKEVRDIYAKSIELLGANFNKKFQIVFDHAKALGKVSEFDYAVAQVLKGFTPDKTPVLVMRLTQTANVLDGANLLARTVLEFMPDAAKGQIAKLLGDKDNWQKRFVEIFSEGILNPQPLLDEYTREVSGFFGHLHDIYRSALNYMGSIFNAGKYKNEEVKKKLFDYIRGTDLNVEKKALKGDELISVRTLIDKDTGKITDKLKMREILERTTDALTKAGLLSPYGGIDVGLDGVAWSALVLKDKASYQELVSLSRSLSFEVGNRGQVGEKELIQWHALLSQNPELTHAIVNEHNLVSKNTMDEFLSMKDFTGLGNPRAIAEHVIYSIAGAFDIIPYEAFNNQFGLLYRTQLNVLKSLEAQPIADFMKKFMTVETKGQLLKNEKSHIRSAFTSYSFTNRNFEGSALNEMYGATLAELSAYLNNVPANAFSERLANIRSILRDRSVNGKKLDELKKNIIELGTGGNETEAGIRKQLDLFIQDFMQNQADDLAKAEFFIDQAYGTNAEVAEGLKNLMRKRLDASIDYQQHGLALNAEMKSILNVMDENPILKDNALNLADEIAKSQKARYVRENVRKYTSLINSDGTVSKMRGFSPFVLKNKYGEKIASDNPLLRSFENQLVPDSLIPVLQQEFGDPVARLNSLTNTFRDWILGIGEEEAKKKGAKTVSFINETLDKFGLSWFKVGDRTEKAFSSYYERLNYDYALNLFKAHALLSPAFHARNLYSGLYVNSVMGVDAESTKKGIQASDYLFRAKKYNPDNILSYDATTGRVTFKNGAALSQYDRDMHELIAQAHRGGVTVGEGLSEIISIKEGLKGSMLDPLSLEWSPLKYNRNIAGWLEGSMRIAAFTHAREVLNYSVRDAADYTKLLHFDYSVLTDFEKTYMKRLIPFYTYMRKAIARDSRIFTDRTGSFINTARFTSAVGQGLPPEEDPAVNDFIQNNLGVPIRRDSNSRVYYLLLGGTIPAADLALRGRDLHDLMNKRPTQAMKSIFTATAKQLSPIIKIPVGQISGYDLYFGKPIKEIKAEYADFFGKEVPTETAYYLNQVRWLRDISNMYHSVFDLKNVVRPDLPAPSELDFGRTRGFLQSVLGVNIRENAKPQDNKYYNEILPLKQKQNELIRQIRRQQEIGNTKNLQQAVQNYKDFIESNRKLYIEKNTARSRVFEQAGLKNKVE